MPSALLLILGGDIPGLAAVTPASAAAANSACAVTDLGNLGTFSASAMSQVTAVNRGGDVPCPPGSRRTKRPAAGPGFHTI